MTLDFQQVHQQIKLLGQKAPERWAEIQERRNAVRKLFEESAKKPDLLQAKVQRAIDLGGKFRCAVPNVEPIDAHFAPPALPDRAEIIASDGSQVMPDRHAEILYYLLNIGALHYRMGSDQPPVKYTESELRYDQELYTKRGLIRSEEISMKRDVRERQFLVEKGKEICELEDCADLLIGMTDGPVELWGVTDPRGETASQFKENLQEYLKSLRQMNRLGMIGCGYIDKPRADLVVRMLEIGQLEERELDRINQIRPYRGVTDLDIFGEILTPGERSAIFKLHSLSAKDYSGELGLYFFYLNVGRVGQSSIARVEIPRWVVDDAVKIDALHAVFLQQCAILGTRPYPYLLHRAHEEALVTLDEKKELTQMIVHELIRNGVPVGRVSNKQAHKDSTGKTRYL